MDRKEPKLIADVVTRLRHWAEMGSDDNPNAFYETPVWHMREILLGYVKDIEEAYAYEKELWRKGESKTPQTSEDCPLHDSPFSQICNQIVQQARGIEVSIGRLKKQYEEDIDEADRKACHRTINAVTDTLEKLNVADALAKRDEEEQREKDKNSNLPS